MRKLFFVFMAMSAICSINAQTEKVLVAYFSCTGRTEAVAKVIAKSMSGDLYCITPKRSYTKADLDWRNQKSRSSIEMADPKSRPELADKKANIKAYDVIFVGYPIWWDSCPRIINTFIESYNFEGKTVIPFATSGGSPITKSENELKALYHKNIIWKQGKLFNGDTKQASEWSMTFKRKN